jgi:hypothetical protein
MKPNLASPHSRRRPAAILAIALLFGGLAAASPLVAQTTIPDPINDASGWPDIVSVSGGFTTTNLLVTAHFRPGTLSPANLGFLIGLDTDLNANTGTQPPNWPVGQDYTVYFNSLTNPSTAFVGGYPIPVSFSADSLGVSVPLAQLGNDNGVARFAFWWRVCRSWTALRSPTLRQTAPPREACWVALRRLSPSPVRSP